MMKNIRRIASAAALLLLCFQTKANVQLPSLFSDNMVLQQQSKAAIWGWADAGEKISIRTSWNNKIIRVTADAKGDWSSVVVTPKAGGPYTIEVEGKNKVELKNVMSGEVWICSGQSNMHYPMGQTDKSWNAGTANCEKEIAAANYSQIRLFTVPRKTAETPQRDVKATWEVCTSKTVYEFSAVAYFFGRELFTKLNVPVGLINTSWGGTPCEGWTRRELLESDSLLRPILERYKKQVEEYPQLKKEYAQTLSQWKQDVAEGKITGAQATIPPKAPVAPQAHKAPYVLYNAMIAPLIPYTIKGAIWYQGEANADRAWQYGHLFPVMIANWRKDWKEGDFPFYFVQIAPHRSQNAEIREAQFLTCKNVVNTGMAVITDAGDSVNIHPANKQIVGFRLSLWALAKTYGKKDLVYSGPMYKSMKIEGNKVRVFFDNIGSGLVCKGDSLTHFTIAGADKKFVKAHAVIDGKTIIVWSTEIINPIAVRFGWENIPMPDFYNKEGLPASPFRTDNWPGKTYGKR